MSRFKRTKIKSSKKSSVSIDEKIAALNKELEKTNMLSEQPTMNTDNVRSTSEYVPPVDSSEADVPDPDPDTGITTDDWTQPLGNDPSGNPASPPPTSFPRIWDNPGYSDPTDGLLNKDNLHGDGAALDIWNLPGWQDPSEVPSGAVGGVQAEFAGMDPGVRGGYLDANGFTATTGNLGGSIVTFKSHPEQFIPVKYWEFFSIFNGFIDSYWPGNSLGLTPQYQGIVKGSESRGYALFTAYKFVGGGRAKYNIPGNPPGNTNPQRRGNEDPPIYPGPIANFFDLGERAYEWLKKKAEEWWNDLKNQNYSGRNKPNQPGSGFPDSPPEPDPTEPDPPEPDPTGGYTPTPQGGRGGGQGNPTNQPGSGTQTQTQTSGPSPTGDDGTTYGPKKGEPNKVPDYKKNRENNRPDVEGGISPQDIKNAADYLKYTIQFYGSVPTAANNMLYHNNVQNPDHPDFRKHDPSSDNYVGPKEVIFNPIEQAQTDKMIEDIIGNLNGGNGPKDPNKLSLDEIKKLSDGMNSKWKENQTWYNTFHSLPTHNGADGEPITKVTKNEFGGWDVESNYIFSDDQDASDPFSNAFADTPLWTPRKATVDSAKKNKNAEGGELFYNKATGEVIGKQFNTQQVYRGRQPRTFSGGVVKESYITESVRLGFFEPKIMDVNLADIKNGIMPEYPKKPPAKMIDGYHEKSRIRPREAKNITPNLKIDKVDLIRNHRLKPSEADEMMNTIKMINDYIKENPADFIHAQMRYPKDDPRLAELNWKMDQMLDAGKEYLDTNFKVNQTSFKLAQDRVKKNTALTNPDYIQKHYDELRGTTKPKPRINRKSPSRFFKKPKKKSSMEAINDKIKKLDKDLLI